MASQYETQLRSKAASYIEALTAAGFTAEIVAGSLAEYSIKLAVSQGARQFGKLVLYYKPKKQAYTLVTQELRDKTVVATLEALWNGGNPVAQASASPDKGSGYQAYVDGSFQNGAIGYGVVIVRGNEAVAELSGAVQEPEWQGMNQVGGELKATLAAVEWCQQQGIEEIGIYYDYKGIEAWATGAYQANKPGTQLYASRIRATSVTIHWHKVAAHTGVRWNERADQLAKTGAGLGKDQEQHSPPSTSPLQEAEEKGIAFIKAAHSHGLSISMVGVINQQCVRLLVSPKGYLDIYNTHKRSLTQPYAHNFASASLQEQVISLWQRFLANKLDTHQQPLTEQINDSSPTLTYVAYLYETLLPFRHDNFDFTILWQAINQARIGEGLAPIPTGEACYHFDQLEEAWFSLKGVRK